MIKLMKYLKKSAGYIVLIIGLLFLQAYCDLSLPDYTSKIINVGIQQGGIPDGVPEKLRESTMESLKVFMDEATAKEVQEDYVLDGDTYELKEEITGDKRDQLNDLLCKPLMMYTSFTSGSEESQQMLSKMQIPEGTDPMQVLAAMPAEAKQQMLEAVDEKLSDMPESILTQAAVSGVKAEYEAMGEDLDAIQMNYIKTSGIRMVLMALVIMLAAVCVTFLSARVAAALGHDLRDNVYRKVIHFSSNEYHKFSTASLITRSTNDVQQVQQVMTMMFRIVLYAPILGIGGVIKVLQTDSSMTWILAVAVVLILLVILVLFQIAMPKFTRLQTLIDRLNLVTREILTGIPVIRAFSREKHEEERFEKANADLTKTNLFVNRCMTFMMPIMMLIMNGVSVAIIYFGAHGVDNGTMQVGNMMAFIQYAMQIIMSFLMITAMSIMLPRANVAALRIDEVLKTEVSIQDPETPVHPSENVKGEIEFDHVSFAYPEAGENVLTDISFKAKKGQTIAVIGSTGSGKSTLINLIPRYYDVTKGSVKVDGVDVRDMTQ
ncbi:MAG: ABC transporter transmembrane domain-containing protein, partial [Clostridia bacterium]|nr:ABC transporter transmembrane domain-containing protein [Clostridia bacterium]